MPSAAREAMDRRPKCDPDRTYLDVDFTGTPGYRSGFNQFAKDCGARFDWDHRLFYIPTNIFPMAALCVFPAISYAQHLSMEIVKYQRDQGIAPSLRQVVGHQGLVRPQRMLPLCLSYPPRECAWLSVLVLATESPATAAVPCPRSSSAC
jgi:hypothetical protein